MAIWGFSVTKRCAFRESTQEFSNVYHYFSSQIGVTDGELTARLNDIVAIERDLHSTLVTFVRGRVWTAGGPPADNEMRVQLTLTGTGNQATVSGLDRERAFLMQWPAGTDSRGKPVKLRKWFHSCGNAAGAGVAAPQLENTTRISAGNIATISARMNDLRLIGPIDEYLLVAESGREHTGPGEIHPFFEHHQFGNQWRAQ